MNRNYGLFGLNSGFGPLHRAAEKGDIDQLASLMKNRTFYYEGALEETARRTSRVFRYFFSSLSRKSEYWVTGTPLHFACHRRQEKAVEWLLDHGAYPDSRDDYGHTPLHHAVDNQHVAIIRLLLRKGAQTTAKAIIADEEFRGKWTNKSSLDIAPNQVIRELLNSIRPTEEKLRVYKAIVSRSIDKTKVKTRADFDKTFRQRLQLSQLIRKRRALEELKAQAVGIGGNGSSIGEDAIESYLSSQDSDGYYNQLKDKSVANYSEYYEPHRSENSKRFGELEQFGYDFESAELGVEIASEDDDLVGTDEDGIRILKRRSRAPKKESPKAPESKTSEPKLTRVVSLTPTRSMELGIINWNEMFQTKIQKLKNMHINIPYEERAKIYFDLVQLERDFLYCSETYGKIIISEYYLPYDQKTIKPAQNFGGYAGGDKYIVHNILFKLAIDAQKIFGPSDAAAAKIGGHELKGLVNYWNCNLDVSLPLMALVDYRGFRIIAMSILPITAHTLVSGSADAGRTVHSACDELTMQLKKAATQLNLSPHRCGIRPESTQILYSATDLEGHIGLDGRFYILDFSRTFPPEAPNSRYARGYLYRLLRPEFVRQYPRPLCPDAFSNFLAQDPLLNTHNSEVYNATLYLFKNVIPAFSSMFTSKINDAIKNHQVKKFSVTYELHHAGINCRMLGLVRSVLPPTDQNVRSILLVEMIARCVKNDIRHQLRETAKKFKIPLEEPYRKVVTEYLNLVFGNGPASVRYWNNTLKQLLMKTFARALDRYEFVTEDLMEKVSEFKISTMPKSQEEHAAEFRKHMDGRFLILARVKQMLGMNFRSKMSVYLVWFNRHRRLKELAQIFQFEDIASIGQRVKHINIIDYAQGFIYKERGHFLERTDAVEAKKYFKKSFDKFSRALESNPNDKEVLTNCADLLTRIHGYGAAQHNKLPAGPDEHWVKTVFFYYDRALKNDPNDPKTLFNYANFLRYWRNEFDLAEEYYLKALQANPNFVSCLREFGNLHNYRGNVESSEMFYERAKLILSTLTASRDEPSPPHLQEISERASSESQQTLSPHIFDSVDSYEDTSSSPLQSWRNQSPDPSRRLSQPAQSARELLGLDPKSLVSESEQSGTEEEEGSDNDA